MERASVAGMTSFLIFIWDSSIEVRCNDFAYNGMITPPRCNVNSYNKFFLKEKGITLEDYEKETGRRASEADIID